MGLGRRFRTVFGTFVLFEVLRLPVVISHRNLLGFDPSLKNCSRRKCRASGAPVDLLLRHLTRRELGQLNPEYLGTWDTVIKTQHYRIPWMARNASWLQQLGFAGVCRDCSSKKLTGWHEARERESVDN